MRKEFRGNHETELNTGLDSKTLENVAVSYYWNLEVAQNIVLVINLNFDRSFIIRIVFPCAALSSVVKTCGNTEPISKLILSLTTDDKTCRHFLFQITITNV